MSKAELESEVSELIKSAQAAAEHSKIVQVWDRILKLLILLHYAYVQVIHCSLVGVHPKNRNGVGVTPSDVHDLMGGVADDGWSWNFVVGATCFERPRPGEADEYDTFNVDLVENSDGLLAPVIRGVLKFFSVAASHTNQGLRAALAGVVCNDPRIAEHGKMSSRKMSDGDDQITGAFSNGMSWTVITASAEEKWPELADIAQAAGNRPQQLAKTDSPMQLCYQIHEIALKKGKDANFNAIAKSLIRTKPAVAGDILGYATFVEHCSGGADAAALKELDRYIQSLPRRRVVRGHVWESVGKVEGSTIDKLIPFKIAIMKAFHACHDKFVINGEASVLAPSDIAAVAGKHKPFVEQSIRVMNAARTILNSAGLALTESQRTILFGRLDVSLVMHVFQKTDPSRKPYKCLSDIGYAFWVDLRSMCKGTITFPSDVKCPWQPPKAIAPPSAAVSNSPFTEVNSDGTLKDPCAAMKRKGFLVGRKVKCVVGPNATDEAEHTLKKLEGTTATIANIADGDEGEPEETLISFDDLVGKYVAIVPVTEDRVCYAYRRYVGSCTHL